MAVALTTIVVAAVSSQATLSVNVHNVGDLVAVGVAGRGLTESSGLRATLINSTAPTAISTGQVGSTFGGGLGYIFPATTGAKTVASSYNGIGATLLIAAVYSGVNTTTPIATSAKSTGNSSNPSVSFLSSAGDYPFAFEMWGNPAPSTAGSSVTQNAASTDTALKVAWGNTPGNSTVNLTWQSPAAVWVALGASLQSAAAAGSSAYLHTIWMQ